MALDYNKIRKDKEQEYGTKVGNYGRLLANLYSDRTHFIFELLQNAEDALRDRGPKWKGSRAVSFNLTKNKLRVEHCGRPFNEADVRGICEIGESAKTEDLTAIGRFGIGFKSVYAITDRPEIHSGPEDFAIENYVLPVAIPTIERDANNTVFLFPQKSDEESAYDDIAVGLRGLGASSLLFLREIDEVQWRIDDGRSGHYLRESKLVDEDVRRVTVIGQTFGEQDVSTEWLVFSRPVTRDDGGCAGHVEVAFFLDSDSRTIRAVGESPLVVFFPTTQETHLGFLMQGPYQTTPSRDNVPSHVSWNKSLVEESSILLLQALRWLRERGDLSTEVLRCLPLNAQRFGANTDSSSVSMSATPNHPKMLTPLFNITKRALLTEPLLPRLNSGYVPAERALLGRGDRIRQLFSSTQLVTLYGQDGEMAWLSSDITQDRAPEIRNYLMSDLGVEEIDSEAIVRKLNRTFLEEQPDKWVLKLYEFLSGQPAIIRMLTGKFNRLKLPLLRLTDGRHVCLDEPQAFLPSEGKTDFPTVHPAVCETSDARNFLRSLGLREPDLVDDVKQNVLPKYQEKGHKVDETEYEADMARIIKAFTTDSATQRKELVEELKRSMFIRAVAPGTARRELSRPDRVYLATGKMKDLFEGVADVRIVDDNCDCMRGRQIQELLEACGATSHLKAVSTRPYLTPEQQLRLRQDTRSTLPERISDWTLMGLDGLLDRIQSLTAEEGRDRAYMLWGALIDFVRKEGTGSFDGTYTWHYYRWRNRRFPAKFVKLLNEKEWIPDEGNQLRRPDSVVFASLGWEEHAFLLSQISFMQPRPHTVDTLAEELGIEPETLDLILEHGVTAEKLRESLGLDSDPPQSVSTSVSFESEASGRGNDEIQESMAGHDSESSGTEPSSTGGDGIVEPFAKILFGESTGSSNLNSDQPVAFAEVGPRTEKSAKEHTQQSGQFGRSGGRHRKTVARWAPSEAAKTLADEFKTMVHGDYGRRCQICGTTFRMRSGELQTFVVHIVEPKSDTRTNHLGALMGLCGQHFAFVRYGEWSWLHPETGIPFEGAEGGEAWERWRNVVLNAEGTDVERIDDDGNTYIGLPIRFWNLYQGWKAESNPVDEIVRYNKPHWRYLCELLKT